VNAHSNETAKVKLPTYQLGEPASSFRLALLHQGSSVGVEGREKV
jgi:hypothetical protein